MSNYTVKLSGTSPIKGSISQGNQPTVMRVTVPGPAGATGAAGSAANNIGQAADVDITNLADGALLQWSNNDSKWIARNELDTTGGTITFNGGSF